MKLKLKYENKDCCQPYVTVFYDGAKYRFTKVFNQVFVERNYCLSNRIISFERSFRYTITKYFLNKQGDKK